MLQLELERRQGRKYNYPYTICLLYRSFLTPEEEILILILPSSGL